MSDLSVKLRESIAEDVPFLFNSWLKSYRKSPHMNGIPNHVYYDEWHEVIKNILSNPSTKTLIVCDDEDASNVLGYVVYSEDEEQSTVCFHYLYVKQAFRGLGIASILLNKVFENGARKEVFHTHYDRSIKDIAKRYNSKCYPMLIWHVYMNKELIKEMYGE